MALLAIKNFKQSIKNVKFYIYLYLCYTKTSKRSRQGLGWRIKEVNGA